MNLKRVLFLWLLAGASAASCAAPLQFTNIRPILFQGFTTNLSSVAYGGQSSFVAVGQHDTFVRGLFTTNRPFINANYWTNGSVTGTRSGTTSNLLAVASSGDGRFVTTGHPSEVYSTSDGTNWSKRTNVFSSTVAAPAIAWSGSAFSAAAAAPQIAFTTACPPPATNWPLALLTPTNFRKP